MNTLLPRLALLAAALAFCATPARAAEADWPDELRIGTAEREDLYNRFRSGQVRQLILSKVGNFAIDLPDANVLIQVSGTFGSRQEEAQRLGRILRPKSGGEVAHFYSLVTRDTREMDFAHHRQLFLTEQGYSYRIADGADLVGERCLSGCNGK